MKPAQFFSIVRQYNELSRRTRKNYGALVDDAAERHKEWVREKYPDDPERIAAVDDVVNREYDPAFRTYPAP